MTNEQQAFYNTLTQTMTSPNDVNFTVIDANDPLSTKVSIGDDGRPPGLSASPGNHLIACG
jgi:hypothetical protein